MLYETPVGLIVVLLGILAATPTSAQAQKPPIQPETFRKVAPSRAVNRLCGKLSGCAGQLRSI